MSTTADLPSSARTFKYESLNGDIRLVVLGQGQKSHPIECTLLDVKFAEKPNYLALSYEWGAARGNCSIWINGTLHKVGFNLYTALFDLRRPDESLVLWIDALCINQENTLERNHQVQLMGEIYSNASEVVIWLGLERDNSGIAMDYIAQMGGEVSHPEARGRPIMKPHGGLLENEEHRKVAQSLHLTALVSWCRRTYWRRMWVIQEIQLAKQLSIHCGTKIVPWSAFTRARRCIIDWGEPFESEKEVYECMSVSLPARMDELRAKGHTRQTPLVDWLETFEESMCTDPKDKVYALVGLASDCQKQELSVDYSKSLPQICFDVMKLYLPDGIRVLRRSDTHTAHFLYLSRCLSKWLRIDSANDRYVEKYDERSTEEHVLIRGIDCGSIAVLGQEYGVSPFPGTKVWAGHASDRVPIESRRLSSIQPISGATSSAVSPGGWKAHLNEIYNSVFGHATSTRAIREIIEREPELVSFDDDQWFIPRDHFPQVVLRIRTIITENGEIILVPSSTDQEDRICLLPHCDVALIFRRFSGQWVLEGSGVCALSRRKKTFTKAVRVNLDIRTLQRIAASAEFDNSIDEGLKNWWHKRA